MHVAEDGARIIYTCNRCGATKEYFIDAPSGDDFDEETHRPGGWELISDEGEGEHLCLKCITGGTEHTTPPDALDLDAIEHRWSEARGHIETGGLTIDVVIDDDVPNLLAEVRRLETENATLRAELRQIELMR